MNELFDFLSRPAYQHLATALLHSLWEGFLIMIGLWILLRRIPAHRPEMRYWTAFSAMLGIVLCVLATWSILDFERPKNPALAKEEIAPTVVQAPLGSAVSRTRSTADVEPTTSQSPDTRNRNRPVWLPYVIIGWLLGVAFMTFRMAWIVAQLRRSLRVPEVADNKLWMLIDDLRRRLHIDRPLRVVDSLEGFGPAVFGFVRPILALPISMITGLPPDTLQAILAHELAHIRRHDYLFNLAQMMIEAVLYFNPAVWWISRQIRIEREACCDALAASILGQPLVLAEALSLWAERVYERNTPLAALAWNGRQGRHVLLDRIRRMVLPGYRPQTPISMLGFLGFLISGIFLLGGLWCGATAAVQLVEKAFTPEERMEKVTEVQNEYRARDKTPFQDSVTLSGKIRTYDGKPLPKDAIVGAMATSRCLNPDGHYMPATLGIQMLSDSTFSLKARSGSIWIRAGFSQGSDDYASAVAGPFEGKEDEMFKDIELVFDKGIPQTIHVIDEKGEPVANTPVTAGYMMGGFLIGGCLGKTNDQGTAVLRIAKEVKEFSVIVTKAGYAQIKASRFSVQPDQNVTVTLSRGKEVSGIVLSPEGKPVQGAAIRLYIKYKEGGDSASFSYFAPVLATTDAEGRYRKTGLADGTKYLLVAESKEFGRQTIRFQTPCENEIATKFGPLLTVTGVIRGNLDSLMKHNGRPSVYYYQTPELDNENSNRGARVDNYIPIETVEGEQRFTLSGLLPGKVAITADKQTVWATVSPEEPLKQVTIDLENRQTPDSMRQVVLQFVKPDDAPPPGGSVKVMMSMNGKEPLTVTKMLPVEKSAVQFDAYAPGNISYGPKEMVGYWFSPATKSIEPGKEPQIVNIPVIPAGAVKGSVLNAEGSPATDNIWIRAKGSVKLDEGLRTGDFAWDINVNGSGKYFISSLPLDGDYTVYATHGHVIQFAGIRLDSTHPIADLALRLPATAAVEGAVVDPEGRPLSNFDFGLVFNASPELELASWAEKTDGEGRFRFTDLSAKIGQYSLAFAPKSGYQPLRVALPLDGKPVVVKMQPGLVMEGQALDAATGLPVPGVEVWAMPAEFKIGDQGCNAEGVTDQEGRFRFSNFEDRPYHLNVRNCVLEQLTPAQPQPDIRAGDKNVVIKVTLPEWCKLKPRQPDSK